MPDPVRIESVPYDALDERFPDRDLLVGFEGGAVYTATAAREFVLITSEGTMADFVDEEDLGLVDNATVYVFHNDDDRRAYAAQRGWQPRRRR